MEKEFVKLIDPLMGINHQAWSVLHYLGSQTLEVPQVGLFVTAPWYNGREQGFVITYLPRSRKIKNLNIAFYEYRNSDSICSLRWESDKGYLNPPTIESDGDAAYHGKDKWHSAFSAECGEIGKIADWI